MSLPVATHRVTILRADDLVDRDSYDDPPTWTAVARHVRAVIGSPSGEERTGRAEAETVNVTAQIDPVDAGLRHLDRIQDDDSGTVWNVQWADWRQGLGLDHYTAGLVRYDGQEP